MQQERESSANCPECDRYIGPVSRCPYCNATNRQSPAIRLIRIIAIILATAGLFLLYMSAKHRQPPLQAIENITPSMNFAYIRITGIVKRKPYISKDKDYLSFRVYSKSSSDSETHPGTNSNSNATIKPSSIQVVAYREIAKLLIENGNLPSSGDTVSVRGSLSVSAKSNMKLYLKAVKHLSISRAH